MYNINIGNKLGIGGNNLILETCNNYKIYYYYDENNDLIGFKYNNQKYYYIRNIFKTIEKVIDNNGNIVISYRYDPYGKVIMTTKANNAPINHFLYKGYYYDDETDFYYLLNRYYYPEICRWISPDSSEYLDAESINGLNLYAYCGNDPINKYDPAGHFGIWAIIGIVGAAILIGGGAQLVSNALAGETGSELWRGVAGAALGSGVNALALCLSPFTGGASLAFAAGLGAAVQTGVDTLETVIRGETVNGWQTVADLGINFITTFAGNWIGTQLIPTNSGWFEPKKFLSVFMKPYGQKILLQTANGAGLSGIVNFTRKIDWISDNWKKIVPVIPVPIIPIYPHL